MDVSIIIINYNTEELILECIKSIINQTHNITYEIIVVDNNSTIVPIYLKSNKQIKLIPLSKNIGFGKACNAGALEASGEYLFFLNPDTILINNAVKTIYDCISNDKNIGICGGNLLSNDLMPIHSFSRIAPGIKQELILLFKLNSLNKQYNKSNRILDVEYITGADLMIKKQLFFNVGGFDSEFFMYYEDTYLCYRIKKMGFRVVNTPLSRIIHLEGKSFKVNEKREELSYESRMLYLRKRYNIFYIHICNLIHITTCISRLFMFYFNKNKNYLWKLRLNLILSNQKGFTKQK